MFILEHSRIWRYFSSSPWPSFIVWFFCMILCYFVIDHHLLSLWSFLSFFLLLQKFVLYFISISFPPPREFIVFPHILIEGTSQCSLSVYCAVVKCVLYTVFTVLYAKIQPYRWPNQCKWPMHGIPAILGYFYDLVPKDANRHNTHTHTHPQTYANYTDIRKQTHNVHVYHICTNTDFCKQHTATDTQWLSIHFYRAQNCTPTFF